MRGGLPLPKGKTCAGKQTVNPPAGWGYALPRGERPTGRFATAPLPEVFLGAGFLIAFFATACFTAAWRACALG